MDPEPRVPKMICCKWCKVVHVSGCRCIVGKSKPAQIKYCANCGSLVVTESEQLERGGASVDQREV